MVIRRRLWTIGFLALPLLVYTVIVIVPLVTSFYYSFTDWNGFNPSFDFVGAKNFLKITTDPTFANAIKNTLIWMAAAMIVPTGAGLAIALVLHSGIRGANFFKSVFYLPICLSLAVVGQVWIWIYHPDWGLLNLTLTGLGLDPWTNAWLANPDTALAAVILAWSWQQIGLAMVIFLAGLTSVPAELTEAAEIDGANYWQSLRHVIVPLLSPATVVVIALAIINSLKSFDVVYIMTGGGPFHSSDTLAMMMYNESFEKYYVGYGSAVSVVLFIIAMVVIAFYFRQVRSLEHLYD
ncbi:MAG TPA: sugar ABC transporter permease [Anaerolineaceae bacterium]|nr:sugar ABC transporter permease [Anaerolineaceae bacterium]